MIDEKLDQIQRDTSAFSAFIHDHEVEHKKISDALSQQKVINILLATVGGMLLSAVIALLFRVFTG